jgi:hypothetical protein
MTWKLKELEQNKQLHHFSHSEGVSDFKMFVAKLETLSVFDFFESPQTSSKYHKSKSEYLGMVFTHHGMPVDVHIVEMDPGLSEQLMVAVTIAMYPYKDSKKSTEKITVFEGNAVQATYYANHPLFDMGGFLAVLTHQIEQLKDKR